MNMIRFLINFLLFGLLFYSIYHFFPDAFGTLVNWVQQIFEFIREMVLWLVEKFQTATNN